MDIFRRIGDLPQNLQMKQAITHTSIQNSDKNTNKIPTFSYFKGRQIPTFSYFGLKIPTFSYIFDLSYHFQPCARQTNSKWPQFTHETILNSTILDSVVITS